MRHSCRATLWRAWPPSRPPSAKTIPFVKVVEYKPIESEEQLNAEFVRIIEAGGEGIMLRLVRGVYRAGRTSDVLKFKTNHYDEAIVIADNSPTDSVRCKLRSGVEFNLGCAGAKHPEPLARRCVQVQVSQRVGRAPRANLRRPVPPDRCGRLAVCIVCMCKCVSIKSGFTPDRVT